MADIATLGIKVTSQGVDQARRDLNGLEQQGVRTERATDSVSSSFVDLRSAIATLGIAAAVREFVKAADEMQNIESRIRLVTKSSAELTHVQSELFRRSQESQTSLRANSELYISMARATDGLNLSQSQLLGLTDGISKAFVVSGAGAQETAGAIRQLGQALQSGALRGDEFNAIAENAPRLMKAMADGMGVARREMRELAEQGRLTTDTILPALEKGLRKVDTEFAQMPQTVSRATTALSNAFDKWASDTDDQIGLNTALANGISGLARNFDLLADAAALTASVIVGKFASSVIASTQAKMADAAATARATQAEAAGLVVKKEYTAMLLAEAQAAAAAATGMQRLAIVQSQVIPMQQRLAAATTAAATAQAAVVPGMALARGALAAMGGPIGLVTTALTLGATAWMLWGNKTDEATAKVEDLAIKRIDGVLEKLDLLNDGLARTSRAAYAQTIQSAETELKTVNAEVQFLKNQLDQLDSGGGRGRFSDEGKAAQERLNQYIEKQIALQKELAYARQNSDQVGAQSLEDYTNKFATAEQKLQKTRQEIVDGYLKVIKQTSIDGVFDKGNASHVAALNQMNMALGELGKKGKPAAAAVVAVHDASEDYAKHLRDMLTREIDKTAKAIDDLTRRYADHLGPLEAHALQLERELDTYGKSEAQIAATTVERYEEVRALAKANGASADYLKTLDLEIEARKRIASATASLETRRANETAAQDAATEWERTAQTIEQSLTDALMRGFESGEGFGENLRDTLINMFKTLVLRPIIQPIAQGMSGFVLNGLGLGGAGSGGGMSGLSNLYSAGSSLYNYGSLGYQYATGSMSGANAIGSAYANMSGTGMDGLLATNGAYGTAGGSYTPGMGVYGAGLGGAMWAYNQTGSYTAGVAGGAAGMAAAGAVGGTMAGTGAMAGAMAGLAAIPVWGWAALAVAAILGDIFKDEPDPRITYQMRQALMPEGAVFGQDDTNWNAFGWEDAHKGFGAVTAKGAFGNIGLAIGSKDIDARDFDEQLESLASFDNLLASFMSSQEVDSVRTRMDGWTSSHANRRDGDAALAERLQAILDAIGGDVAAGSAGITGSRALGQYALNAVRVDELQDALEDTGQSIGREAALAWMKEMTTTQTGPDGKPVDIDGFSAISGMVGGMQNMLYPMEADESFRRVQEGVVQMFAGIDQVAPRSIEEFRRMTEGIDLSTEAGRDLYEQLVGIAPAFMQVAQAVQAAFDEISKATASTVESFALDVMSAQEKYAFYDSKIDETLANLATATDPAKIMELFGKANSDLRTAWGLLDETEKKRLVGEFQDRAYDLEAASQARLSVTPIESDRQSTQIREAVRDGIRDGLTEVADRLAAAGGDQAEAANALRDAVVSLPGRIELVIDSSEVGRG